MQEAELELLIKKVLSNMDINNVSKNSVVNNTVSSNSSFPIGAMDTCSP